MKKAILLLSTMCLLLAITQLQAKGKGKPADLDVFNAEVSGVWNSSLWTKPNENGVSPGTVNFGGVADLDMAALASERRGWGTGYLSPRTR